jgi:hypothetical protein
MVSCPSIVSTPSQVVELAKTAKSVTKNLVYIAFGDDHSPDEKESVHLLLQIDGQCIQLESPGRFDHNYTHLI